MTPPDLLIRPARPEDAPALGELFLLAFERKVAGFLGRDRRRSLALLTEMFREGAFPLEQVRVAEEGGRPVGFCLVQAPDSKDTDLPILARCLARRLGIPRAVRSLLALSLLGRPGGRDTGTISALAVAPPLRSRGIGSTLIAAACDELARRGVRKAGLDVVWGNERARALYERHGFRVVRDICFFPWLTERLFGFRGAHYMEKPLL